jgi:hypothetical protein
MAYRTRVLVVANRTADSEGLTQALCDRDDAADAAFTLLVPKGKRGADGSDGLETARVQLKAGIKRIREAGLEVDGVLGDPDPIVAVAETWKPGQFDEVIVSTLEREASRWLEYDLPHRVSKLTDCPVQHVVPAEVERENARRNFRRPLKPAPQRALGPFIGPSK